MRCEVSEVGAVEEGNNLDARREQTCLGGDCGRALVEEASWNRWLCSRPVEFFGFGFDCDESGIGICTLLQQQRAFDDVGIVDDLAVVGAIRLGDLAEPDLGSLLDDRDVLDADGRAVRSLDDSVFNLLHVGVEAGGLDVDLLCSGHDEAAAGVGVVVRKLGFDGGDAKPVGDQLIRVQTNLVFLGRSAEAGDVDDARHALELLLDCPVFERLLFHHVEVRVLAGDGVPVNLADGAPVGLELRLQSGGQRYIRKPFQHTLTIPRVDGVVVEVHYDRRDAGQREGAEILHLRNAGHLDLGGHGDLLFDILRRVARPLGDDVDVVVGDVGIGLDGEVVERDSASDEQHDRDCEDENAVLECEVYKALYHWASRVASSWSTFETTC